MIHPPEMATQLGDLDAIDDTTMTSILAAHNTNSTEAIGTTDDWEMDFLSAVACPIASIRSVATETAAHHQRPQRQTADNTLQTPIADFEINTPTVELTSSPLMAQFINGHQRETVQTDTVLAEMKLDVVDGAVGSTSDSSAYPTTSVHPTLDMNNIDYSDIENIWTLSPGSPDASLHAAVPLAEVEGSFHPTDVEGCISTKNVVPPIVQPEANLNSSTDESSCVASTSRADNAYYLSDNNKLDSGGVISGENVTHITADQAAAVPDESEVAGLQSVEGLDLLDWIMNDTIHDQQIPGEMIVKEDEDVQAPPSTVESLQLFKDYYDNKSVEPSTSHALATETMTISQQVPTQPQSTIDMPTVTATPRQRNVSTASSLTTNFSDISSVSNPTAVGNRGNDRPRRGRGRPPKPPGRDITPAVRQGRIVSDTDTDGGNLTEAEISDYRYRRMRDLNNEASKRCRENRKRRQDHLEAECEALKERNIKLHAKLSRLENVVGRVKTFYLTHIVSGQVKTEQTEGPGSSSDTPPGSHSMRPV